MNAKDIILEQVVAGWLLILSGILFLPSGILFMGRAIWKWPAAQSRSYLFWERGFVMAAILVATLGFILLAQLLERAGDRILPPLALTIFLVGAVLDVAAESFGLHEQAYIYAPIAVFVILSFVGQAVFGAAILRTGYLPGWTGWTTVIWSLAWLVILPLARPHDMYYPWLHYVAPLVMGIALVTKG